jgi:type II secretory pathway component GspD/PulD (secretin)
MKPTTWYLILCSMACGLMLMAADPPATPATTEATNEPAASPQAPADQPAATDDTTNAPAATAPAPGGEPAATASPPAEAKPDETAPEPAEAVRPVVDGERGLRLNFRGAPLEMVLNYLSEAAGFIIVPETDVKGKVDVWSNQPLTKEEAVEVLNGVLNKNGYAIVRSGRTLRVVSKDEAKKLDIPVKTGNEPANIPKNDEMVTQIVPVRFVSAVQLSRDLQPLMPPQATVVANEGGNAIVITDTQINIRRMTEIIKALDTTISSVSSVRVFSLSFADAKSVATMLKDLFQTDTSAQRGNNAGVNPMQQLFRGMRGGGNFPGAGGGGGGGGGAGGGTGNGGRVSTPKVVAVADERSNSVIVSAPDDQMPVIKELIEKIDGSVEDITELRVFRLRYADPQETADLLTSLFPDTTSTQNNRTQVRFGGPGGGGPFGGFGGGANNANAQSSRAQKQSRVTAVPDLRTGSVVVSAARDLLEQIAKMIEQLDSDPAKKQKVFVYSVENTDPQEVQDILQGLFATQNGRNSTTSSRSSSRQTGNQLNNRATTQQSQGGRTSGANTSGFGGSSGATSRFGGQ